MQTFYFITYLVLDRHGERTENAIGDTHPLNWLAYITRPIPNRDRFYRLLGWHELSPQEVAEIGDENLTHLRDMFPQ